jgi:hypothetical protein
MHMLYPYMSNRQMSICLNIHEKTVVELHFGVHA